MGIKFQDTIQQQSNTYSKKDKESIWNKEIDLFGSSFSNKHKEDFYGELSLLLYSGINLKQSLELISEMQKKEKHKLLITEITDKIVAGSSLSEALEANKKFTSYEYQAIKIGEQTGKLGKITNDLREFFNRKNELKRQLISSLSYPLIVLLTAVLVVFFMLRYVVPMFVDIFKQNNVELPWITEKIINASNFMMDNGWIITIFVLLTIIAFRWASKTNWYYKIIGMLQLKIPALGNYIKKIYLIQFTQAMSLLTNAKIPVVAGIGLVRDMIKFYPLENALIHIEKDIVQGEKLHDTFSKHTLFDKKMVALLRVAEETNQTEYIFQKLYDQYNTEIKYKGDLMTKAFNFIITLFVALIVGVILVAMYLPMFKLSSVIG
jgi:type II secretory pathway component PulF